MIIWGQHLLHDKCCKPTLTQVKVSWTWCHNPEDLDVDFTAVKASNLALRYDRWWLEIWDRPKRLARAITWWICIWEVPGSKLNRNITSFPLSPSRFASISSSRLVGRRITCAADNSIARGNLNQPRGVNSNWKPLSFISNFYLKQCTILQTNRGSDYNWFTSHLIVCYVTLFVQCVILIPTFLSDKLLNMSSFSIPLSSWTAVLLHYAVCAVMFFMKCSQTACIITLQIITNIGSVNFCLCSFYFPSDFFTKILCHLMFVPY
jgi:hypothetical protein